MRLSDRELFRAETLRRWLRASCQPAARKRKAYRQRREARAHFGELLQEGQKLSRLAWIERYGIPQALYTDWKHV